MTIPYLAQQIGTFIAAGIPVSLVLIGLVNKFLTTHHHKLGKTTTICTNIAGVLTKDSLMVRTIYFDQFKLTKDDNQNFLKIENIDSKEELLLEMTGLSKDATLKLIAITINLCRFEKLKEIEKTIINFFVEGGINKHKISNDYQIIQNIPSNKTKKMSTVVTIKKDSKEIYSFTKGHPKTILKKCSRIQIHDKKEEMTHQKRRKIRKYIDKLNNNGQKVIALAYKPLPLKRLDHYSEDFTENDLVFLGIIGVTEPLNTEITEDIKEIQNAGIKTYILTSAKEKKAIAIGKQLKIINPQYFESITGLYLQQISDQKLTKMLANKEKDYVFCELKEKDKLRIIHNLNLQKEVVAISDKTHNTNFKEITEGVKKGRIVNYNFRKYTHHALACKIAELLLLIVALIIRVPLPLTITLIIGLDILINFILELALRVDKSDIDVMTKNFQQRKNKLFKKNGIINLLTNGLSLGIIISVVFILSLYIYGWTPGEQIALQENIYTKPATITITLLAILQIINAFSLRNSKKSIIKSSLFHNPYLVLSTIISILLLYIFLSFNFFTSQRSITAISTLEWQLIAFFAVILLVIEEFRKFIIRLVSKNDTSKPQ